MRRSPNWRDLGTPGGSGLTLQPIRDPRRPSSGPIVYSELWRLTAGGSPTLAPLTRLTQALSLTHNKESYRWVLGYDTACEVQRQCPETLVVSVADREGDIHEWFLAAAERDEEERAAFVIRAKCNRRVAAQPQDTYLWEALRAAPVLGRTIIEVAAQARRAARQACLTVRTQAVRHACRADRKSTRLNSSH